ncbi:MAG: hypothetical protein MJZ33_05340 [Paludibacteraceae bacterium]|nr:hypothetical protein [Paludibacteraceae bacterium]
MRYCFLLTTFMLIAQNAFCYRYRGNENPQYELPKSEISVSYGLYSIYDLLDGIEPGLHIQDCEAEFESSLEHRSGSISIDYSLALSTKVRLGVMASYMSYRHDVKTGYANEKYSDAYVGELKSQFIGILPKVQLYWFSHEHVAMYSKFALGAAINVREMNSERTDLMASYNENKAKFEFQVSPICLEAGGSQLRGFAELGCGNYLFSAGMKYYW